VTSAVSTEQVRSRFRQIPIALSINFVNAALVAIVLTPLATQPLLLPWFISVMLVTVGRGFYGCAIVTPSFSTKTLTVGHGWQLGVRCSQACPGGLAESSFFRSSRCPVRQACQWLCASFPPSTVQMRERHRSRQAQALPSPSPQGSGVRPRPFLRR
jgi:hypothetical protein